MTTFPVNVEAVKVPNKVPCILILWFTVSLTPLVNTPEFPNI